MKKLFTFVCAMAMALSANAVEQIKTTFGSWGETCTVNGNTLEFSAAWAGAGVDFTTGDGDAKTCTDMSSYDYLWLTFSETTCDFVLDTQYTTKYNQDVQVEGSAGALCVGLKLNEEFSDQFAQYFIQSKGEGKIVVTGAYVGTEKEYQEFLANNKTSVSNVSLKGWGKWDAAIEYTNNEDGTLTIQFPDAWKGASNWFGGKDASDFDYLVLEIAEPVDFQTQIWIQYSDNTNGEAFIEPGETSVKLALDEAKKSNVNQIAIQSSAAGTVKVQAVYFCTKDYNPSTGISNAVVAPASKVTKIYNLAGQQVSKSYKGVVIKNGKKYVQ